MPEILRLLIHAMGDRPVRVDFPSGESTQGGGWDGILETTEANSPIPQGMSGWEISVRRDVRAKADEDYEKRKRDALGLNPGDTTFVFVTPRRWSQKRKWENDKKADGFWADVRALDADDLEQWLERAEAVSASLATTIGKYPQGVQSLEGYWQEYSNATLPPIPAELLLVNRDDEVKKVREWLDSAPSVLDVHADSTDEAVAFLAAVILSADGTQRDQYLSRTLVGMDIDVLRNLSVTASQLKLVWLSDDRSAVGSLPARGHYVFVPLARTVQASQEEGIVLPRPRNQQFCKALENAGLREEEAEVLTKEAGSRITVLRRRTAVVPTVARPEWATPEIGPLLVPALLAGAWAETSDGDRDALAQLAGTSYEEFARSLPGLAGGPDSPLRRVGDAWTLAAPLDAWYLLAPHLTIDDLRRIEQVCLEVLGTRHPRLDLDPDERWKASVFGKNLPHSGWLREGLAHTLILLAVVGEERASQTSQRPRDTAESVVWRLLGKDGSWERWYSLSGLLPLLAEAAPERFLESSEDSLERDPSEILGLFGEEGGGLGPNYRHTGLLWALEVLAWYQPYLGRVTRTLGKLAQLDPGVKIFNSPRNTLKAIFLPWLPQTTASLEDRLGAMDLLIKRESEVGWRLLLELLPKGHDSSTPNSEPRWREKPSRLPLTNGEHFETIDALCRRVIEAADLNSSRVAELVAHLASFPSERRVEAVGKLQEFAEAAANGKPVWDALRQFLHRHRKYEDSDWTLPSDELDRLDGLLVQVQPEDVVVRSGYLFDDDRPDLPNPAPWSESDSYEEEEQQIDEARTEAILAVTTTRGLEGLHSLARASKHPEWVGRWAGKNLDDPVVEGKALAQLGVPEEPVRLFSIGFIGGRAVWKGEAWVESFFASGRWEELEPERAGHFCLGLAGIREVWDKVSEKGEKAEKIYWASVWPRMSPDDAPTDIEYAIRKLLWAGQVYRGLEFADWFREKVAPGLLKHVLDQLCSSVGAGSLSVATGSLDYHIEQILARLRNASDFEEVELAKLEWKFLPLLRWARQPVTLHRWLARDPTFFAEVVKWAFRPRTRRAQDASDNEESTELMENRAQMAYELLSGWPRPPGRSEDGSMDELVLQEWVNRARELCREADRAVVGDQRIGNVLAYAPVDADGTWPHSAVRNLIEDLESRQVETGIEIGVRNKRGVTTRALDTGGEPERSLAEQYRQAAEKTRMQWTRTAAMLDRIAESYEREGRREDEQSEQTEIRG